MQDPTIAEMVRDAVRKQAPDIGSANKPIVLDDDEAEAQPTNRKTSTIRKRQGRAVTKGLQRTQPAFLYPAQQRGTQSLQPTAPDGMRTLAPRLARPPAAGTLQVAPRPVLPPQPWFETAAPKITPDSSIAPTPSDLSISPLNTIFALSRGLNEPWIGFIHAPEQVKRAVADLTIDFADSKKGGNASWFLDLFSATRRPTKCLRVTYARGEAMWTKEVPGEYACRSCVDACKPCCVWNPNPQVKLIMVLLLHPTLRCSMDPKSAGYWVLPGLNTFKPMPEVMRKVYGDFIVGNVDVVEAA